MSYHIGEQPEPRAKANIPVENLVPEGCPHCSGNSKFDLIVRDGKVQRTPRHIRKSTKIKQLVKV